MNPAGATTPGAIDVSEPAEKPAPLPGPVTMGEFRARLAEMTDRVLAGEEIVVLRGTRAVARFVPIEPRRRKRLGTLQEFLSEDELRRLDEAIDAPLSDTERRLLRGEGSDELGIWVGLPDGGDAGRA